jgi:hypothetical protein
LSRVNIVKRIKIGGRWNMFSIPRKLPEDIAAGLESRWKDLPRAALESLALEAYRSVPSRLHSFGAPWFPDSDGGRRFSKGARNLRLLGCGFRTGPRDSSGAPNKRRRPNADRSRAKRIAAAFRMSKHPSGRASSANPRTMASVVGGCCWPSRLKNER